MLVFYVLINFFKKERKVQKWLLKRKQRIIIKKNRAMSKITIFRILVCFFILPQLKWTLFHLTRAFFVSANTDAIRLKNGRTFEIDYTGHRFLKNGQDYRYISGEIHYFRIHSSLWYVSA